MVLTQLLTVSCTCTLDNGQPVQRSIPISRRYEVLKEAHIFLLSSRVVHSLLPSKACSVYEYLLHRDRKDCERGKEGAAIAWEGGDTK
jgi:hypothetical protein